MVVCYCGKFKNTKGSWIPFFRILLVRVVTRPPEPSIETCEHYLNPFFLHILLANPAPSETLSLRLQPLLLTTEASPIVHLLSVVESDVMADLDLASYKITTPPPSLIFFAFDIVWKCFSTSNDEINSDEPTEDKGTFLVGPAQSVSGDSNTFASGDLVNPMIAIFKWGHFGANFSCDHQSLRPALEERLNITAAF